MLKKRMMYIAIVMTALSAVIFSAQQLRANTTPFGVCNGTCSATVPCAGGCFCNLFGSAAGFCTKDPVLAKAPTR